MLNYKTRFVLRLSILGAGSVFLQLTGIAAAAELKPTYRSSYSTQTHDNRWAAERDIHNAAGWPGSEMAENVYSEDWSVGALRSLYSVRREWIPKQEYFGPTLWTSELQAGLCNDCPLFDAFGNERCSAGDQAMCASESAIDQAIEAVFGNYCDHYIDSETPWFFVGFGSVGPALPDGTQVYGTWFKKLYTVKYWQEQYNCLGPPHYQEWIYDGSAYSWTACPTGYYDASTVAPDGRESCSNHFDAWLYEYNPLEFGGDCPAGNPCYPKTGAKSLRETDFTSPTLELTRSWNSIARYRDFAAMGRGWTHNYSQRLIQHPTNGLPRWKLLDGQGAVEYFECADAPTCSLYRSRRNPGWILKPLADGWEVLAPEGQRRVFDAQGRMTGVERRTLDYSYVTISYLDDKVERVTDLAGRSLAFNYNSDGMVDSVTLPDGLAILFDYERPASVPAHVDWQQRLVKVTRQDLGERSYHYEDEHADGSPRFEFLVTGITDENGIRFASYAYDERARVVSSEHALGAGRITLEYTRRPGETADWTITEVTKPLGEVVTFEMEAGPFRQLTGYSDSAGALTIERDPLTAWRTGRIDRKGLRTNYEYADGLHETRRVEAVGTPDERAVETDWENFFNRVTQRRQPGKTTTFSYNGRGQVLSRAELDTQSQASRTWAYSYHEAPAANALLGRLHTVDGPRTDVADITTYEYHPDDDPGGAFRQGDLHRMINALGQVTEYLAHDANGRPLLIRDPNGTLAAMTYHPRGWITSRSLDGQVTTFAYDAVGNLVRVTQPDGSFTAYEFDAAQRLVALFDKLGNRIEFTLDAEGNRIGESIFNDAGILRRQLAREFNQLNRLRKIIDGNLGETRYGYDANGNRTSIEDPNLNRTEFEYDPLDRLVRTIDAALGETRVEYDARGNVVALTDPLGNTTSYEYDAFDNTLREASPAAGETFNEFDEAGNRTASTDARGIRVELAYDALNRPVSVDYPDDSLDVAFSYDTGPNGAGRLTGMSDSAGTESFVYDARGNLARAEREITGTVYSTQYAYTAADRLSRLQYPSGMEVAYTLDAAGRVIAVDKTVDGLTENLVHGIDHEPFGPVRAFTYGNGLELSAGFDLDYEMDAIQTGPDLDWVFSRDSVGNILSIQDQSATGWSQSFSYDDLYRLETAAGTYGNESYEYDANGNRTRYLSDLLDETYAYEPQTGRLIARNGESITRDPAGNRVSQLDNAGAGTLFAFGDHNRLGEATRRQVERSGNGRKPRETVIDTVVGTYLYDGRGQRVAKTAGSVVTHFVYGQSGELLGEYLADGSLAKEYIWLGGQPVAVVSHLRTVPEAQEIVVDNDTAGTERIGAWSVATSNKDFGPDHRRAEGAGNLYRWTPSLDAGVYDVYAWWVSKRNYSESVDYRIIHDGETETVTRSHRTGGGQWQLLGSWEFDGSGTESVEVEAANGVTIADAVRFVRVDGSTETTVKTYFVHSDHLGTPRIVSDAAGTTIWRWDSRPFGDSLPNQDPDGDGAAFELNLRFPGQYYDVETGLHYNYFRDYDPSIGRYLQSDPIGLSGGLNLYGYVVGNPLRYIDPAGLEIRGSWIDLPALVDYDVDFEGISLGERFDLRGFPPGMSFVYLHYSYNGTVQGVIYCIDDDACNPRRWMMSPKSDFGGEFQFRIWLTPLKNPWGAALTMTNAGIEASDIAKVIYDDAMLAAQALKDRGPTALCKASAPHQ